MAPTIDAHGNLHDDAGKFEGRANSAPLGTLGVARSSYDDSQRHRPDGTCTLDHDHGADPVRTPRGARAEYIAERARLLDEEGFVPALATPSITDPRSTERRAQWWDLHRITGEMADGYDIAQMPDDFTPARTTGRALSGHRRTHRMLYEGSGVSLRMPSATAIKRFAKEPGEHTFDVPVEAVGASGKPIAGHVRVTMEAPGVWSTQALGMPEQASIAVGESVAAVLEARRPTIALKKMGDVVERHRERKAASGSEVVPPATSSWITGVGYNAEAGEMVVQIGDRTYGYHVDRDAYEVVASSTSPGRAYNALVKGSDRVELEQCQRCSKHYNTARRHTCMRVGVAGETVKPYNVRVRNRIFAEAARV